MPHLQDIYEEHRNEGLKMVAINIIPDQDPLVPEWKDAGGYDFPILVGAETERIFQDYAMRGAPLTFILDSRGQIVRRFDGYQAGMEADIEAAVREALERS